MRVRVQPWSRFGPLKCNLNHQYLMLALNSCASGESLIPESRPHVWWKSICNNLTCSISPLPDCQIVSRAGRRTVCYSIHCSIFFILRKLKRNLVHYNVSHPSSQPRLLGQRCVFHPISFCVLHINIGESTGYLRECTLSLEWGAPALKQSLWSVLVEDGKFPL